jgi:hypothetical protein
VAEVQLRPEPEALALLIAPAGRSLGSAVAVELSRHVRIAGLVLFSPLDSVPLAASRLYPWAPLTLLATNRFDNHRWVAAERHRRSRCMSPR